MSLLSRVRPDLRPRTDNVPQQPDPPAEPIRDTRPAWVQLALRGELRAKEMAR
jgi:hypothetical protein